MDQVRDEQATIREYVHEIGEVAATLESSTGDVAQRKEKFVELTTRFQQAADPMHQSMAVAMISFIAGLFVGESTFEELRDNLDLERWFR